MVRGEEGVGKRRGNEKSKGKEVREEGVCRGKKWRKRRRWGGKVS